MEQLDSSGENQKFLDTTDQDGQLPISHFRDFQLGFHGEKTTYLHIHHPVQPTPDSESLATIHRTDNEALLGAL